MSKTKDKEWSRQRQQLSKVALMKVGDAIRYYKLPRTGLRVPDYALVAMNNHSK